MRIRQSLSFVIAGLVLSLPVPVFAGTCALCRQALASGGNAGLIQGFYWSILLIAGMPLIIMGVVAVVGWRRWKTHWAAQHPNQAS